MTNTEHVTEIEAPEEHTVRGAALPGLQARIAKLAKRAAKLGVPAPELNIISERTVYLRWHEPYNTMGMIAAPSGYWTEANEQTYDRREREYTVTVTGEAVQLPGGWKLAGTLQHTEVGNAVRMVPGLGIDAEPFRTGDAVCDQCNTSRRRLDTYLVVNDEGTVKRVGSNCIRDFLGYGDPSDQIAYAKMALELFESLGDDDEYRSYASADHNSVSMLDLLEETVAAIDAHGWVSKGNARMDETPTSSYALGNVFANCDVEDKWHQRNCNRTHRTNARPTDEQKAEADVTLTYCRDKFNAPDAKLSDYEWNLNVALARDWIEPREAGIVASAVFFVRKEQEREINRAIRAKAGAESEYVGELKERLRDLELTVTYVREFGDQDDLYGTRTLVKFADANGNIITWWSSNSWDEPIGTKVVLTGTVKKHEEFKGTKSTVLTRCKVEIVEEVKEDA